MLANTPGYFCVYLEQVGLVATCLRLYVDEIFSECFWYVIRVFLQRGKALLCLVFFFYCSVVCKSLKCTHSSLLRLGMSCTLGMKRAIANGDGGWFTDVHVSSSSELPCCSSDFLRFHLKLKLFSVSWGSSGKNLESVELVKLHLQVFEKYFWNRTPVKRKPSYQNGCLLRCRWDALVEVVKQLTALHFP